jgi:ParB-like nuclease domain
LEIKCSYTKLVPLSELKPYSRNRNSHSEDQINRLSMLLDHHGQRRPIIVSTLSGEIVAGNGTFLAMQKIGAKEVAVDYQDFENSDAEYTFSVSDNAISEWAELDLAGINSDLADLGPFDLDLLGIKDFKVDVAELELDEKSEIDIENKYRIEVQFPNDMEMNDIKDDLLNRGYIVRVL